MQKIITKKEQVQASHKHAKHLATMHLVSKNAKGAAEAFKNIPELIALEFLFDCATNCRLKNKHEDALIALEAARLIKRVEQDQKPIKETKEKRPLRSSRLYPAHVFEN